MFYPEESLKKGGRFYLCWVADSWPLCFATITHRQLWSQDIRKICDDLLEVMNNESGRPTSRFSLRLSSQLMRGLVRLYQRKVTIMLSDLCMINAKVMKSSHKKFNVDDREDLERRLLPALEPPPREPAPENEERVEEILQQSGNIVANIEDITLKEAAIPDFQLPPNDGFGEHPSQQDRTLELMLGARASAGLSALAPEPPARARSPRPALHAQMELISDQDLTLFHKSMSQDPLPVEFEKDIPIPEIPPPDLPVPMEKELIDQEQAVPIPGLAAVAISESFAAPVEELKIALPAPEEVEDLEELEPQVKRRRKNKLIVDKKTILSSNFLRSRIDNIAVELRCESSTEDIADLRVPWDTLLGRPAAAGTRYRSKLAHPLTRMFSKRAGFAATNPLGQREMELAMAARTRCSQAPHLEIICEEAATDIQPPRRELQLIEETLDQSAIVPDLRPSAYEDIAELSAQKRASVRDIAELPTQKLRLSAEDIAEAQKLEGPQKRPASQDGDGTQRKRQKSSGVISYRQYQLHSQEKERQDIVEKENIPCNRQTIPPPELIDEAALMPIQIHEDPEQRLTSLLQAAGLADMEKRQDTTHVEEPRRVYRRRSESSETMLGSLDRTKVSLGDSEQTTDSKRFIRDQWGTEGTMVKILKAVKAQVKPITVESLLSCGPVLPGCLRTIAARCFNSILKLKQHGFIKVHKESETLEIRDIVLGPKFDIN